MLPSIPEGGLRSRKPQNLRVTVSRFAAAFCEQLRLEEALEIAPCLPGFSYECPLWGAVERVGVEGTRLEV